MSHGENAAIEEYKCGAREAVELSSKFWNSSHERKYVSVADEGYITCDATSFKFGQDCRRALLTHHHKYSTAC